MSLRSLSLSLSSLFLYLCFREILYSISYSYNICIVIWDVFECWFLVQSDISNPHTLLRSLNARGDCMPERFPAPQIILISRRLSVCVKTQDLWFLFQMANDSTETSEAGEEEEEQEGDNDNKERMPFIQWSQTHPETYHDLSWSPCHCETYVCVRVCCLCVSLPFWTMQSKILQNTKCVVKCSTEVPFLVRCWNVAVF